MNNSTLDSNPQQRPSSLGSELPDKSKDISIALSQQPLFNKGKSQNSADIFEEAKIAFFSK